MLVEEGYGPRSSSKKNRHSPQKDVKAGEQASPLFPLSSLYQGYYEQDVAHSGDRCSPLNQPSLKNAFTDLTRGVATRAL